MNRITHDVQQGTGPWLRLREDFFTASEAPSALGVGKYTSRSELLRRKHTGVPEDHSQATLAKFRAGHAAEDGARPLAEAITDGDLYPVTMSLEFAGLKLLASLDGLTLDGATAWETKLWNEELAANVRAGTLPGHYTVQMDQELLVSGAQRCLFTCTDGTSERLVSCWYEADQAKFDALIEGWHRFAADLAEFSMPAAAAPAPAGKAPETLPALHIEVTGAVTASNLAEFKKTALAAIQSVNRELKTDQDFADATKAVKWCADIEERLQAAKQHALSQTASIDALFKTMDDISAEAKRVRLDLNGLVTRRKTEVKEEAVVAARNALAAHYQTLNAELSPARLDIPLTDFAGAIKGLRSFDSMQDALDTLLAKSKITADTAARGIRANLVEFEAKAKTTGFVFLFSDLGHLVHKAPDDFALAVQARIDAHKAAEAKKEEEARERIRAEEAQRQQAERQRQERLEADRKARIDMRVDQLQEALTACASSSAAAIESKRLALMANEPSEDLYGDRLAEAVELRTRVLIVLGDQHQAALEREAKAAAAPVAAPAPLAPVAEIRRAPAAEQPTLKLGRINERLGFVVTADFLASLGFAAHTDRSAKLYREGDFKAICAGISAHVLAVGADVAQAA